MALTDYINTQPSEANITNTGISDPFGLKEDAKKAFKNQTGVAWENASQETINDLRDSQFNPILEETGAVNEDGSYNDDVMDDVTQDPEDIHDPAEDPGGDIPLIGGTSTGGLPSFVPGMNSGNTDGSGENENNDPLDFLPLSEMIKGSSNTNGLLEDIGMSFVPENNSGSGSDNSGFSLGFLEKIMLLAAVLILGPSIIKALSGGD